MLETGISINPIKLSITKKISTLPIWKQFVFDHESGHALAATSQALNEIHKKNKVLETQTDMRHIHECISDTYAVIRFYQRSKEQTDIKFPQYLRDLRELSSYDALLKHYKEDALWYSTYRCIDKVIQLQKKNKLKKLSPDESINMAINIAINHHFTHREFDIIDRKNNTLRRNSPSEIKMLTRNMSYKEKSSTKLVYKKYESKNKLKKLFLRIANRPTYKHEIISNHTIDNNFLNHFAGLAIKFWPNGLTPSNFLEDIIKMSHDTSRAKPQQSSSRPHVN